MHITAEDIIVEIVDQDGQPRSAGEPGEIVVTHLATPDFPFVRYRTGDVGSMAERSCGCGRGLPLLKDIQGRTTDFITASDGTVMHGLALIYILRDLAGIDAFKIIQESLTHTKVLLVTQKVFKPANLDRVVELFKARLGNDVTVDVQMVESIPRERSGKYRYVVSNVRA